MSGVDRYYARKLIQGKYPDPTPEMIETPEFQAVFDLIDDWYIAYREADHYIPDGAVNFVRAVLDALACVRDGSYKPTPYASDEEDEDADKFSGRRQCMEAWERNKLPARS